MNRPLYEVFAKGVQVTVWANENQETGHKFLNVKVKERYLDSQGMRRDKEFFSMDSVPLLISALQRVHTEFCTMITTDNRVKTKDQL